MCLLHSSPLVLGLANGILYALIALGYTLVYGVLQLINFAHSEVFMAGAYGGVYALDQAIGDRHPTGVASVLFVVLGIVSGAVIGGLVAFLLERIAYRPLRKRGAPKLTYLISAIGASFFLQTIAGWELGQDPSNPPAAYTNGTVFTIGGAEVQTYYLIIAIAGIVMLVFLDRLVAKTKLGQGIRAVAQDADTASLMGVDINRVISQTFIIGGMLGGAAGFLFAISSGASATMGTIPGIKAFTAAVLGGIGNVRGAVLGGLLLGIVESYSTLCLDTKWTDVIAFVILVLVLLVRPTGLLGERLGRSA